MNRLMTATSQGLMIPSSLSWIALPAGPQPEEARQASGLESCPSPNGPGWCSGKNLDVPPGCMLTCSGIVGFGMDSVPNRQVVGKEFCLDA